MKPMLTRKTDTLTGLHAGLIGNCTGLRGDCSDLRGNLDACEITSEERVKGVSITSLVS